MARIPVCHPLNLGVILERSTSAAIAALAAQSASVARTTANRAPVVTLVCIILGEGPILHPHSETVLMEPRDNVRKFMLMVSFCCKLPSASIPRGYPRSPFGDQG